ncbi:hypothetical protein [Rubinisphaera italica]|nr:hypothetical protein [Rubinisphaera italica]HBN74489.1 hypothetical protein [Planctomycetaceae bacterium]|tara:strand:- start:662 stop:1330 length:669 start_codon:yes stop_codon:yes gene_type:complete
MRKISFLSIVVLVLVITLNDSVFARNEFSPQGQTQCVAPHVVMIRGVGGYWPKVDHLAEGVMQQGMTVSIHHPYTAIKKAGQIACYCRENTPGQSVNIIAYSLGCDAAIVLCQKLEEMGMCVDSMILIETTFCKNEVPGNVRYCFNLYEERGLKDRIPIFRGVPLQASNCSTVMINAELKSTCLPARKITHFNIASKNVTHELVLEKLLSCHYWNNGWHCCE